MDRCSVNSFLTVSANDLTVKTDGISNDLVDFAWRETFTESVRR